MYNNKKVLAIIPARGGSKGVTKKNLREVGGKPMIYHTIIAAQNARWVDRVFVSTDDEDIRSVAENFGVEVPFLRSGNIALDDSPTSLALLEVLDKLKKNGEIYDYIIELHPTYCFRKASDIDKSIELLIENPEMDSLIVVEEINSCSHPDYVIEIENNIITKSGIPGHLFRRQNLRKVYGYLGFLIASKIPFFKKNLSMYSEKMMALPIDEKLKKFDINDEIDLYLANALMDKYK